MKQLFFVWGAVAVLSSCSKDSAPVAPAATPLAITAQPSLGGNDRDMPLAIAKTPDGGYVVAGYTQSTTGELTMKNAFSDAVVVKYNANHVVQWKKVYGGNNFEYATSIICTPDGGYLFAGSGASTDGDMTGGGAHGGDDVWVVKLDATGTIQWQKAYGGTKSEVARSVALCPDGGYVIAGFTEAVNGDFPVTRGSYDCLVFKISSTGALQWQRTMGSTQIDQANGITCGPDGVIVMVGTVRKPDGDVDALHGGEDMWVVKFDAAGNVLWKKNYGSTNNDQGNAVITVDGGYVITGMVQANGGDVTGYHDNGDIWTFAIDETGKLLWQKTVGGSLFETAYGLSRAQDDGYFITGQSSSSDGDMKVNRGNADVMLIKLSKTGQLLWQKNIGSTGLDQGQAIIPFGSRGCVVAASATANDEDITSMLHPGNFDWWLPVIQ